MSETCLESRGFEPIGTFKEVLDAIIAEFPGSERETSRAVAVRVDGEHIAAVYAFGPNDEDFTNDVDADSIDNPRAAASQVTWFNIMGDDERDVTRFLIDRFGVEEVEM